MSPEVISEMLLTDLVHGQKSQISTWDAPSNLPVSCLKLDWGPSEETDHNPKGSSSK